jgi:hypothetical protein
VAFFSLAGGAVSFKNERVKKNFQFSIVNYQLLFHIFAARLGV